MKEIIQWYVILGAIFVIFAGIRARKYDIQQDEWTAISWILFWPIWMIGYIANIIRKKYE